MKWEDIRVSRTQRFWNEHSEWSQRTFGTDQERGPLGALKHLEKEAREAQAELLKLCDQQGDPTALEMEITDCLFLTFDAARRAGMTLDSLLDTAFKKLEKNKTRVWAKPATDNEPIEHVRGIND
jgi:NTP pyrophosphatase (non-canonical NTP hydrolase)